MKAIEERGWGIMNGTVEGDEEEKITYTGGRGKTVIDYLLGNGEVMEVVVKMEIGEEVDSVHHPVVMWLKGGYEEKRKKIREEERRGRWDEEGRENIKKEVGRVQGENGRIEEDIVAAVENSPMCKKMILQETQKTDL